MKVFLHLQIAQLCRRKIEKYCSPDRRFGCETAVAYLMLIITSAMTRRDVKTCLAASIAAVLLFYNAAWAVLRCCHIDDHGSYEESLSAGELVHGFYPNLSRPSDSTSQIDCLDFDYHIESLTVPAPPRQVFQGANILAPYTNDFVVAKSLIDGPWHSFNRNTFTRGSPNSESSDPPLYLSISSLRI